MIKLWKLGEKFMLSNTCFISKLNDRIIAAWYKPIEFKTESFSLFHSEME